MKVPPKICQSWLSSKDSGHVGSRGTKRTHFNFYTFLRNDKAILRNKYTWAELFARLKVSPITTSY